MDQDQLRGVITHFMGMAERAPDPMESPRHADSTELTAVRYFLAGLKAGQALPEAEIADWQHKLDALDGAKQAQWQQERERHDSDRQQSPEADRARSALRTELMRVKGAHDRGADRELARRLATVQGMARGFRRVGLIGQAEYVEWEYAITEAAGSTPVPDGPANVQTQPLVKDRLQPESTVDQRPLPGPQVPEAERLERGEVERRAGLQISDADHQVIKAAPSGHRGLSPPAR